jgi:hypothetical protein
MSHHFVIDEFITFSGLYDAIKGHHPAEYRIMEDHQMLMLGLMLEIELIDAKVL